MFCFFLNVVSWKDYNNKIILEQSQKKELDLGLLIKKNFTKSSMIEQSVLDSKKQTNKKKNSKKKKKK